MSAQSGIFQHVQPDLHFIQLLGIVHLSANSASWSAQITQFLPKQLCFALMNAPVQMLDADNKKVAWRSLYSGICAV